MTSGSRRPSPSFAMRLGCILGAAFLAPALVVAAAPESGPGPQTVDFPAAGLKSLRVDLHCGEIHIERGTGDAVQAEMRVTCERNRDSCWDKLADVKLTGRERSGRLIVEVDGTPRWHSAKGMKIELTLRVPDHLDLDVDLGAGEVKVEDAARDVRIDLGAGQIDLRMPEDAVRSVDARAGVGDARLHGPSGEIAERRHLIGGAVHWTEGKGEARVDLEVGAGEVVVRLR